ncbi:Rv3654c family TadE-like protein [Nakamurella leprariae]|uniref:Flp pilus-assembly TadE/G-like family protein n=1 Tax=Nakamurella leprariae TaxID=2803911 RepID=A0A939BWC5_9ACTN|nr:Rv3654c family TadE-like protein [Nakamurella leprariae]MBM9467408.1 flp pilus-assembly TadE/G-like family protein [Nakamurella leprariae]
MTGGHGAAHAGPRTPDRGSVTVLAGVAVAILVVVASTVVLLAAATGARQRAERAADLAALAGAAALVGGADRACQAAVRVAVANDARVESCRARGLDLLVETAVPLQLGPVGGTAVGRARAGPAVAVGSLPPDGSSSADP